MILLLEKLVIKYHRLRFFLLYGRKKLNTTYIYGGFDIVTPSLFFFGERLSINNNVYLNATGKIIVGDNVIFSEGSKLITAKLSCNDFNYKIKKITLGDNIQIGAGAIVLPGVSICSNVIVGAGAVVTKSICEAGVYVGNPARKI